MQSSWPGIIKKTEIVYMYVADRLNDKGQTFYVTVSITNYPALAVNMIVPGICTRES